MLQLSLVNAKSNRPQLQYKVGKGRKQTIRLGPCTEEIAKSVKEHFREMILAKMFNRSVHPLTAAWLGGIDDSLHEKFAKHELVASRSPIEEVEEKIPTVCELADYCIELWYKGRKDCRTAVIYGNTRDNLTRYFKLHCPLCKTLSEIEEYCKHCGADAPEGDTSWPVDLITAGHADEFVDWMLTEANPRDGRGGYAAATVNKRINHTRRFFKQAVRRSWIDSNPLDDIKAAPDDSDDRKFLVRTEIIKQLMKEELNPYFRLVIALARYGGLRCPSEIGPLRRSWVEGDELLVHTVKLAHIPKKKWRKVPIFPVLKPYITEVMKLSGSPDDPLIAGFKCTESALTSRLKKLCKRADVTLWKKPWVNLRSTRITELEDSREFSEAALDAWLGNSREVRKKHYNQVTKEQLQAALSGVV